MRWSIGLGKIFGINFRVHLTFPLLLLFVFVFGAAMHGGAVVGLRGVLFICTIFLCVLIHEIGHSLIARRFGKEAKSITLLPIGGVSLMEEMPEKPGQEITMAAVGPFINLAIAGVLYLLGGGRVKAALPGLFPESAVRFYGGLIGVNIALAVFNLIPAFPMDGGRVFRGILALKLSFVRATAIAAGVGQVMSMAFIFLGIFSTNWLLALVGFFLYLGGSSEKEQVMLHAILREVPASEVMVTDFRALRPEDSLGRALEMVYHGCQHDFPVMGDRGLEGILTRGAILSAVHEKGVHARLSEVMDRNFGRVRPDTPLDDVYRHLLTSQRSGMAVMEGEELKGVLSLESISRYLMIQSALRGEDADRVPTPTAGA